MNGRILCDHFDITAGLGGERRTDVDGYNCEVAECKDLTMIGADFDLSNCHLVEYEELTEAGAEFPRNVVLHFFSFFFRSSWCAHGTRSNQG